MKDYLMKYTIQTEKKMMNKLKEKKNKNMLTMKIIMKIIMIMKMLILKIV